MALTSMLGLTGLPMAIGALAVFGSSFVNYACCFDRLKIGDRSMLTISVAVRTFNTKRILFQQIRFLSTLQTLLEVH